ncbi:DUF4854 domain-containing protein [Gleimia sp. 6138-11-ORH1]|uniref:DUF4854 domain-containing protein n=1 Tax=Gleimia sp. 6138-11-ORH1 TaxID=2973937 RepID=UPI0021692CB7|nr:DUF4854 domain-containing protein [Gleimia sp. 6138-11-ORH1]MCS4484112.1 DUF4854 domain-containing protein [Gleimia sp. 6138-11-ORH1]
MRAFKKLPLFAVALGLTVSLSACGGASTTSNGDSQEVKSLSEAKGGTASSDSTKATDKDSSSESNKEVKDPATEIHPFLQKMVDQINSTDLSSLGADGDHLISVRGKAEAPSTLVYEYVLKDVPDAKLFAESLDKLAAQQLEEASKLGKQEMERAGIVDPKVAFRYLDKDGNLIWERTF